MAVTALFIGYSGGTLVLPPINREGGIRFPRLLGATIAPHAIAIAAQAYDGVLRTCGSPEYG